MRVEISGDMGLVKDDNGKTCGLWVKDLSLAELDDDFKPGLRMFIASFGEEVSPDFYGAIVDGNFSIEENSPEGGGGYFLMLPSTNPAAMAKKKEKDPQDTLAWKAGKLCVKIKGVFSGK